MANIAELNVKGRTYSTLAATAGAATFTVPLGENDGRATLYVYNGSNVTARVVVAAGDGLLSDKGDLSVDIATTESAAIPLRESMRFKVATTSSVGVALNSTADTSLTATPLALIHCVLIQG